MVEPTYQAGWYQHDGEWRYHDGEKWTDDRRPAAVHCPMCNSGQVEKISGASKVGAGLLGGLFALGHVSKTFWCHACQYRW